MRNRNVSSSYSSVSLAWSYFPSVSSDGYPVNPSPSDNISKHLCVIESVADVSAVPAPGGDVVSISTWANGFINS